MKKIKNILDFPSMRNLKKQLGDQDSCFQANQISMLFLEEHIKNNNLNSIEYIRELSEKFRISYGAGDWAKIKKLIAYSYIVQTYNNQEVFLKEFISEYIILKNFSGWKAKIKKGTSTKDLDPYSQLKHNLDKDIYIQFWECPESNIIQYYRQLRNEIVHKSAKNFDKSNKLYSSLIEPNLEHFKNNFKFLLPDNKLPAPNSPLCVTYDDYMLYSKCLKIISKKISLACNLTVQDIFDFEINNIRFTDRIKKYNPYQNKFAEKKFIEGLKMYFKTYYGGNNKFCKDFSDLFANWMSLKKRK